jgi:serine/threonine protein kinase/HEAT repeat protein
MLSCPAANLAQLLRERRLLDPAQLAELARLQAVCPDAQTLLRELTRRGVLSAYQAERLRQGRPGELEVGPYRLVEPLGQGATGQVFKARHARMARLVALKVLAPQAVSTPRAVARFEREAQAAARLSHPHIAQAYDAGEADGRHFLAMELVEGIDLASLVRQSGPLAVPLACELIRQAALGLAHAHDKGLVHRDVKPSNLMVTRPAPGAAPLVKVLDFGLARLGSGSGAQGQLTQLGKLVGTVDFIAPEQAEDARRADARADLYSLGCTLFFLLTGRPPFPGRDLVEKLSARVLGEAPLGKLRPGVPAELQAVLARLLARDPHRRFASAAEVAHALEPFCRKTRVPAPVATPPPLPFPARPAEETVAEGAPSRPEAGTRQHRHRRRLAALVGVGALGCLALLLVAWSGRRPAAGQGGDSEPPTLAPSEQVARGNVPRRQEERSVSGPRVGKKPVSTPPTRPPAATSSAVAVSSTTVVNGKEVKAEVRPAAYVPPPPPPPETPAMRVARLTEELKRPDPAVRRRAAVDLAALGRPQARPALPALLALAQAEADPAVRRAAAAALPRQVGPEDGAAAPALTRLLVDRDVVTARSAALALGNIGGPTAAPALPVLREALQKGNKVLRAEVAAALANLGSAAVPAVPDLARALADTDPLLRRNAALALGRIGPPARQAVPALAAALQPLPRLPPNPAKARPYEEARVSAAEALAQISYPANEKAIPALRKAIRGDANPQVRQRCTWAVFNLPDLGKHGLDRVLAGVLEEKAAEGLLVRYDAARVLAFRLRQRAPDRTADLLLHMLQNRTLSVYKGTADRPTPDARYVAAEALGWLGDKARGRADVVAALRTAGTDANPTLRDKAQQALKTLGLDR